MSVVIHGAPSVGAPAGEWSLMSAWEYLVSVHPEPLVVLPISAKPTEPPAQFGSFRMLAAKSGSGSAQLCCGACVVVRVARGQKSLSSQEIPLGGGCIRFAG